MVNIVGKYQHERNENLDEYFKTVGVPYLPRKMMQSTSPSLEITTDENGQWTITIASLFRTQVFKFKLGEEYEERMPGAVITSKTILDGDKLLTDSTTQDGVKTSRAYEFTDDRCVVTYKHEASGVEAKRYFKRV